MANNLPKGLLRQQGGFQLIEVMAAVLIISLTVTGSVVALGAVVNGSSKAGDAATLVSLVQTQIETIRQVPFESEPANYPAIANVPEGITVTVSVTDAGASYDYPESGGLPKIQSTVQKISVTAKEGDSASTMAFYKIKAP